MECNIEEGFDREFLNQFQQLPWLKPKKRKEAKTRRKNQRRKPPNDQSNGLKLLNKYCVPSEILVQIFNLLDFKSLTRCSSVCRHWNAIITNVVWRERLQRLLGHPIRLDMRPKNIKRFCFNQNFNVNLVQNPSGEDGVKFWETKKGESYENVCSGETWESKNVENVADDDRIKNDKMTRWFQINYQNTPWDYWSKFTTAKCQWIDLAKFGFTNDFMDEVQPPILIQDWYRFAWIGENYSLSVFLKNDNSTNLQQFHFSNGGNVTNRDQWIEVRHEFKNYGKGVRFVYIVNDSIQSMDGRPSAKISGTSVIISSNILRTT